MLPANDLIYVCPFCGAEKALLQLASGNTFGGRQWWDMKTEYPMLPQVSPIQQCPKCGKYFPISQAESHDSSSWGGGTGELSYDQAREAWVQLKDRLNQDDLVELAMICLHTYNDMYQRCMGQEDRPRLVEPTTAEKKYLKEIVEVLVQNLSVQCELVHAELLREAGEFERAEEIVNRNGKPTKNPMLIQLYDKLLKEIKNKDTRVTLIEQE